MEAKVRELKRKARHTRIRKKVVGTAEQPRMSLHRSHRNLFVQVVNDTAGKVVLGMSTLSKNFRSDKPYSGNIDAATAFGDAVAAKALEKGIKQVSFDRGGYLYHGRVKAFAEAARKGGMEF